MTFEITLPAPAAEFDAFRRQVRPKTWAYTDDPEGNWVSSKEITREGAAAEGRAALDLEPGQSIWTSQTHPAGMPDWQDAIDSALEGVLLLDGGDSEMLGELQGVFEREFSLWLQRNGLPWLEYEDEQEHSHA